MPSSDALFVGSIPDLYDRILVPLIFQHYAEDMSLRVAALAPSRVLETAAGTGVVTRELSRVLPVGVEMVATDLNQQMLDRAAVVGTDRPVRWQQADAMALPFDDSSFDAVICQFGVMFFPDKAKAFAEARRVLRPGGAFVFNVWDGLADNDFARLVDETLATVFPQDPPDFIGHIPHGYHDRVTIAADLMSAGFTAAPSFDTVVHSSRAVTPLEAATAVCQATPVRNMIESHPGATLAEATAACAAAITEHFGDGPVEGKIQAQVVLVRS